MRNNYLPPIMKSLLKYNFENFFTGFNSGVDESVLPLHIAKKIYNFDISDGTLSDGYGINQSQSLPAVNNVANVWNYRFWDEEKNEHRNRLMFSRNDGRVLFLNDANVFELLDGVFFVSLPISVNYRLFGEDVILMMSESDGMFVWNGKDAAYKVEDAPKIRSLTMHFERMFVTTAGEANSVYFSDDLDPTNWGMELNEGGFIQFIDEMGSSNKVISFLNHVYIFRDYGISRITAFGDQTDFSATSLFISSGKIYGKTPMSCGDRIMFLASDGLYMFDGLGTIPVAQHLKGIIKKSPYACSAYHDGKYFLALNLDIGEDNPQNKNNSLLTIDLKTGLVNVSSGFQIDTLSSVNDILYAVCNGQLGIIDKSAKFFNISLKKNYETPLVDLGTDDIKTIREFYIDANIPFELTLYSEKNSRKFKVIPKIGLTRLRMNFRGRKIGFAISTDETGGRISRPGVRFSF